MNLWPHWHSLSPVMLGRRSLMSFICTLDWTSTWRYRSKLFFADLHRLLNLHHCNAICIAWSNWSTWIFSQKTTMTSKSSQSVLPSLDRWPHLYIWCQDLSRAGHAVWRGCPVEGDANNTVATPVVTITIGCAQGAMVAFVRWLHLIRHCQHAS